MHTLAAVAAMPVVVRVVRRTPYGTGRMLHDQLWLRSRRGFAVSGMGCMLCNGVRCMIRMRTTCHAALARGSAAAAAAAPTSARCRSKATSAHASASGWLCTRYGLPATRACLPTACLGIHRAAGDIDLCVSDQRHVERDDRLCESRIDVPAAVRPVGQQTIWDNRVMLLISP